MSSPLRLIVYDRTCRGRWVPGLLTAWSAAARVLGALGRIDHAAGFADWPALLAWLATIEPDRPIGEIQLWCHGKWGCAMMDRAPIDVAALRPGHPWSAALRAIRERSTSDALWWFRTCETFGADAGHRFAREWTDFFGGRAAGHTFVIGAWQSGLHSLAAGAAPSWSATEGLVDGSASHPVKAAPSRPGAPNTITCFQGRVPDAF